jgi:hypothetical protein
LVSRKNAPARGVGARPVAEFRKGRDGENRARGVRGKNADQTRKTLNVYRRSIFECELANIDNNANIWLAIVTERSHLTKYSDFSLSYAEKELLRRWRCDKLEIQ